MRAYILSGKEPYEFHVDDAGIHDLEWQLFEIGFRARNDKDALKKVGKHLFVRVFGKNMKRKPKKLVRVLKKW